MTEAARGTSAAPLRRLDVEGAAPFGGDLKGKGEILLQISDASRASLTFDYASPDRLVLGLDSKVGLRISNSGTVTLEGAGRKNLLDGELTGEVSARLSLARTVDLRVEQRFRVSGSTTTLEVRIRL